jgi:hypothetical protein
MVTMPFRAILGLPRRDVRGTYDAALRNKCATKLRQAEERLRELRRSVGGELRTQSVQLGR